MKKILSFVMALCLICTLLPAGILTTPVNAADGAYTLVTSAADLQAGDKVVIVANGANYALSTTQNGNNRGQAAVTKNNTAPKTVTFSTDVQVLTLEAGKIAGTFAFNTGSGYLYAASSSSNYLRTEKTLSNNSSWSISITSAGVATVKAQGNYTRNWMRYNSSSKIFACYSSGQGDICIYKQEVATGCDHANKVPVGTAVEATCTTPGMTAGEMCADCGDVLEAQKEIAMADHSYGANGTCSVCGQAKPKGYIETEASKLDGTQVVVVTMTNSSGTYALTNGGGTSSAPAATKVTVTDGMITENVADNLKWNVTYSGGNITIYPNGTTATWLYCTSSNNGVRVGTNTNKTFTISGNYLKHTGTNRYVGIYNNQDWRCYTTNTGNSNIANQTLKFYVLDEGGTPDVPACEHTETVEFGGVAANCTTPGKQAGVMCANPECGHVITEPTDIPALGHNYVDGECTVCHTPDPFINLPGRYYIAAYRNSDSKNYYMTSTLTGTSTKRYAAVAVDGELPALITDSEEGYVFVVVKNSDGTYSIQAEGVKGNNYLSWSSGNSGAFAAAGAANTKFIPEYIEKDNTYKFLIQGTNRYLSLNEAKDSNYFAWYEGTQVDELTLIPVADPVVAYTYDSVTTKYASWDDALAAALANNDGTLKLLADQTIGQVDFEDVTLDLNGYTLTADAIVATVKDSSNGNGLIKLTSEADAVITPAETQFILWDNTDTVLGYRVFTANFVAAGMNLNEDDTDYAKSFWSDLDFTNSKAYQLAAASGMMVGFKLEWNGAEKTFWLDGAYLEDWADEKFSNTVADLEYYFYITVTGFVALEDDGILNVTPVVADSCGNVIEASAIEFEFIAG